MLLQRCNMTHVSYNVQRICSGLLINWNGSTTIAGISVSVLFLPLRAADFFVEVEWEREAQYVSNEHVVGFFRLLFYK